jgi:hypothetical protein
MERTCYTKVNNFYTIFISILGISEIYSRYYESEESRNYFLQMALPDLGDGMEGEEREIVE